MHYEVPGGIGSAVISLFTLCVLLVLALLHLMRKRKDRQPLLPAFVCRKRKVFEGLLYPAPQPKQAPQPPLPHVTREVFAPPAATQPEIVVKNE